jgi:hypothetical protein
VTDAEVKELRDMVVQMHQALIGNGVEGCIPRMERMMRELSKDVDDQDGRLIVVEGKVKVGQWVLMTAGSILMACLIGGIWTIAVRI